MTIRTHEFVPNSILTAAQMNDVGNNGVIQVGTAADLAEASLVDANVAFVVDEMKLYKRDAEGIGQDKWSPFSGGSAGAPGPVQNLSRTGTLLTWDEETAGAAGPTLGYGATIEPNTATVTVDSDNREAVVSGFEGGSEYVVSVFAVNQAGAGEAVTDTFTLNYNSATGGVETVVDDYNGTGQKWKVHTFEVANGGERLTTTTTDLPFEVLIVAGGNGIGYFAGSVSKGGEVVRQQMTLYPGTAPRVTVGAGGSSSNPGVSPPGNPSAFNEVTAAPGLTTATQTDNISGADVDYGGNGQTTGVRGRGQVGVGGSAKAGQPGIVIIAYEVGTSSTREVAVAHDVKTAHDDGYEEGFVAGEEHVQTELVVKLAEARAELEELKK